jgi:hypothetical protein
MTAMRLSSPGFCRGFFLGAVALGGLSGPVTSAFRQAARLDP